MSHHHYLPLILFLLLSSSSLLTIATPPSSLQTQCTTSKTTTKTPRNSFFPSPTFLSTLRSTLAEIQSVMSIVSTYSGGIGGDLRLSSAVSDCLDLLDLSSDELTWTISASQPAQTAGAAPAVRNSGTGKRGSDVRSWMSAALGNQDTCKEGLVDADGIIGSVIAGSLDVVNELVASGLGEIASAGVGGRGSGGGGRRRLMEFPRWMSVGERRLLQAPAATVADAVVAKDGTGNFTTVSAAVAAVPPQSTKRFVIYVKKGVYKENVEIKKKKWNVMMVGDGMGETVISASRSYVDGWTTYRSATFAVSGKGFIARDLTIENTAGPTKHQAVALRSDSDLSVYYRCAFSGYQDTLYAHSLRQFYRDCRISGTVDYVFGDATAIFQNCLLSTRLPLPNQKNSITAQGRKDPNQNTGFSFQFCNVTAEADLVGATNRTSTYLGRPWKQYSRTVFMQSYIGELVRPEGWLEWNGEFALKTLYYAEFMNNGPGAGVGGRVKWPGFHAVTDPAVVANFTVAQFIDGNMWLPATGVKFTAGLEL